MVNIISCPNCLLHEMMISKLKFKCMLLDLSFTQSQFISFVILMINKKDYMTKVCKFYSFFNKK